MRSFVFSRKPQWTGYYGPTGFKHDLVVNNLTSLDVYTKYRPGEVIETEAVDDACSGMNPVYYIEQEGRLRVSSSAASLIPRSGTFELNPNFRPPKFLRHRVVHHYSMGTPYFQ